MRHTYRNDLVELARLAEDVESFAAAHNIDAALTQSLNLCLDELFTNVVSYAYEDAQEHAIHLDIEADASEVRAILRDDGRAFDPLTQAPAPDLDASIEERRIGGLGVHFVKQLMTRAVYRRENGWNVLEIAKTR